MLTWAVAKRKTFSSLDHTLKLYQHTEISRYPIRNNSVWPSEIRVVSTNQSILISFRLQHDIHLIVNPNSKFEGMGLVHTTLVVPVTIAFKEKR